MRKTIIICVAVFFWFEFALAQQPNSNEISEVERLSGLTVQLYSEKRFNEALPLAKKALALSEKSLGPEHEVFTTALNNVAKIYVATGKIDEAEQLYLRAMKTYEKKPGIDPAKEADVLDSLAFIAQYARRDFDKARNLYQRALKIRENSLGADHEDVLLNISNLIDANMADEDYKAAAPLLQRLTAVLETKQDSKSTLAEALQSYAYLLRREKRQAEADAIESRLSALLLQSADNKTLLSLSDEMIICRGINLVLPNYPVLDTLRFVSITVEVRINEEGKVEEARATGGPNAFAQASVMAARKSSFVPITTGGQAIKYSGPITYEFIKYRSGTALLDDPLRSMIQSRRCVPVSNFRPS